jgi:two-component system repressor protein LuxO
MDGYRVVAASRGDEALAQISQVVPQLVLLDVRLPDASGLDLLQQVRRAHPQVGVFMMTGFDEDTIAAQATALGAIGVVSKPLDFAALRQRIRDALATMPTTPPTP